MSEEKRKILEMLADKKITVDEAERLLGALGGGQPEEREQASERGPIKWPKFLRVQVEPGEESETGDRVNIRIPIKLIRAGLKWATFIPKNVRADVSKTLSEKGIDMDFDKLRPEDIEELLVHLNDLTVDVEGKDRVKIFCE
jgi:hypothetical protein